MNRQIYFFMVREATTRKKHYKAVALNIVFCLEILIGSSGEKPRPKRHSVEYRPSMPCGIVESYEVWLNTNAV
jgi:hypothetical protein